MVNDVLSLSPSKALDMSAFTNPLTTNHRFWDIYVVISIRIGKPKSIGSNSSMLLP